jgi:hypothetical protein
MLRKQLQCAGVGEDLCRLSQIGFQQTVGFSAESQNRVRTDLNATIYGTRKMHAEEGELRVWHGIDHGPTQRPSVMLYLVINATERDDLKVRLDAAHPGDFIGVESATVNHPVGVEESSKSYSWNEKLSDEEYRKMKASKLNYVYIGSFPEVINLLASNGKLYVDNKKLNESVSLYSLLFKNSI